MWLFFKNQVHKTEGLPGSGAIHGYLSTIHKYSICVLTKDYHLHRVESVFILFCLGYSARRLESTSDPEDFFHVLYLR